MHQPSYQQPLEQHQQAPSSSTTAPFQSFASSWPGNHEQPAGASLQHLVMSPGLSFAALLPIPNQHELQQHRTMQSSPYQQLQQPHAPPVLPNSSSNVAAHLYGPSSLAGQWCDLGREMSASTLAERSQHYPPIRTRSGDWDQSRPQLSGRVDLGAERSGNAGSRMDGGVQQEQHQQQSTMLPDHAAGPSYAAHSMYNLPSHHLPSTSSSSRPPLDAAPQYYQPFSTGMPPHYSHNTAFYLPPHQPQPPQPQHQQQQHLGAGPSPTYPQQQTAPPSPGDSNYGNSTNTVSPTLPSTAYYQQHRHSYPNINFPPLHTPNSMPSTPALTNPSRPSTAGAASTSTSSSSSSSSSAFSLNPHSTVSAGFASSAVPAAPTSVGAILQRASTARASYHSGDPVLAYNPAREPSAPTKAIVHRGGVKYAVGTSSLGGKGPNGGVVVGTGKAKLAELQASCYVCGQTCAKMLLRGNDVEFGPRADFTCLSCLPPDAGLDSSDVGDIEDQQYAGTLSAAVDRLEGLPVRTARIVTPEQTQKELPASRKNEGMTCDVCDRVIGAGTIKSSYPGPPPPFTIEILCYPCLEKYKACSDCGGGGGRLTPGRWRCKELFPAGRRTCQLSHARNPPLADIEYHVLSVRQVDQPQLEYLTRRCREVYVNTRLRTCARPEMLERADGLATTWEEAERMTVDEWHLLVPLLFEDVEQSRSIRRYVAYQKSTPHRRRAKPKVPVTPPPEEEAVSKELSGFMILEHDLVNGTVFVAAVMPWAISGDSFEATTILGEQSIQRIRHDLAETNQRRAQENLPPYPALRCTWCISAFRMTSRMTQSLTRRGYLFLDDFEKEYPGEIDSAAFSREIDVPAPYVSAYKVFVRRFEGESDLGSSATAVKKPRAPRIRKRKAST